jgi:hypothetical protein
VSLPVALGVDPGSGMDQLGHTDPSFTLRVYRHRMRWDQASKEALRVARARRCLGSSDGMAATALLEQFSGNKKPPRPQSLSRRRVAAARETWPALG